MREVVLRMGLNHTSTTKSHNAYAVTADTDFSRKEKGLE